jgi:GxxExxY protein
MPINVGAVVEPLDQPAFARVAYDVMETIFAIHQTMGRLFDEEVYQQELLARIPAAQIEIPISVEFDGFKKPYAADLLVASGALFELKTAESIHRRHKSQLLHYLMLMGLNHGKVVNLRTDRVEHEFVNTHLALADRKSFTVDAVGWNDLTSAHGDFRKWLEQALRDWGAGLDLYLYQEAAIHFFGGDEQTATIVPVVSQDRRVGFHRARSCGAGAIFEVTALSSSGQSNYEDHLRRLLSHTPLAAIQWINTTRRELKFKTVGRDGAL